MNLQNKRIGCVTNNNPSESRSCQLLYKSISSQIIVANLVSFLYYIIILFRCILSNVLEYTERVQLTRPGFSELLQITINVHGESPVIAYVPGNHFKANFSQGEIVVYLLLKLRFILDETLVQIFKSHNYCTPVPGIYVIFGEVCL